MNIELRTRGLDLSDKLSAHIDRRLRYALTRFRRRLRRVHVMVEDLNGPKGGNDTQCKVRVEFVDRPALVLREVREDAYSAVARAAERVSYAVSRRLERLKTRRSRRTTRVSPFDA